MQHRNGLFHVCLLFFSFLSMACLQGCSSFQTISSKAAFRIDNRDIYLLHQGDKTWKSDNAKFIDQSKLAGKFELLEQPPTAGTENREMHLYLKEGQEPLPNQFSEQTPIAKDSIKKAKIYSFNALSVVLPVVGAIVLIPVITIIVLLALW